MNSNPNTPPPRDDMPRTSAPERDAAATEKNAVVDASAKLKEAQAKLLEADAKLMPPAVRTSATAVPERRPSTTSVSGATKEREAQLESHAERTMAQASWHAPARPATEGLSENVAGMLCYLFGWVSGLVFLLIDRRPFVRFHAAQSVAVFATLSLLLLVLSGFFLGTLLPHAGTVLLLVARLLELVWLGAAVVLMLKAAAGERFRVKLASRYADRAAHEES